METNEPIVKTSVNTASKNKRTLKVLIGIALGLLVFSLLYAAVIYPSL
jgi:hypothetical protein